MTEHEERVRAALRRGDRPDRVPVTSWRHAFREEWDASTLASATVAAARRHDWDLVKLQPRATCYQEAFGAAYHPSGSPAAAPTLTRQVITSPSSWGEVTTVSPDVAPLRSQTDALRLVVEAIPDRAVFQTVFSPFTVMSYLAATMETEGRRRRIDAIAKDEARAVAHLREVPDLVTAAAGRIAETMAAFARRSVEAGADGIFYAIGGSASRSSVTAQEYAELVLPHDLRVLEAVPDGIPIMIHLCGDDVDLHRVERLPRAAVSLAAGAAGNPSLPETADTLGCAVVGGVELSDFAAGSDAVATAAAGALAEMEGRDDFILGPGCSVYPYVDAGVLDAMANAPKASS